MLLTGAACVLWRCRAAALTRSRSAATLWTAGWRRLPRRASVAMACFYKLVGAWRCHRRFGRGRLAILVRARLVRGTEGSLGGLILIFVASTFTLIIDDGPKLRVDLHRVLAGWAYYKVITVIPEAHLRVIKRWCNGDASQRADGRAQPSALRTNLPSTRDADDAPPPPHASGSASLRPSKKEDALRL